MRAKSNTRVLSVQEKDPSKSVDMNSVLKSFLKYLPAVTECGNIRAKTLVQGKSVHDARLLCNNCALKATRVL